MDLKPEPFPFVHGESIESERKKANSVLRKEMKMNCDRINRMHVS
jgi:hypothetical protein